MTIKELTKYLKDNPNKYWFKRKIYGWGWVPVTWQGWLVIGIFIIYLILTSMVLDSNSEPTSTDLIWFFLKTFLAVVVVILICYKKGEKPKWKWGLSGEEKEKYGKN